VSTTLAPPPKPQAPAALGDRANAEHRACLAAAGDALQHARAAGQALAEAKQHVGHGGWGEWLADNFEGSERTAQVYMRVSARWEEIESKAQSTADLSLDGAVKLLASPKNFKVHQNNGNAEWYTPAEHVEAVRQTMGAIDVDPASCELAQRTVKADIYFTAEDDGLAQGWHGRVFLNPPFKATLIAQFVEKLCEGYLSGDVSQAVLLTNNNTDTAWWHRALESCAAVCFTRGRVPFCNAAGTAASPTNGHTFFYFGHDVASFQREFAAFGAVVVPRATRQRRKAK